MTVQQGDTVRLTGGCQCGAVRYALGAQPAEPDICHCRMCQKASGGPYMAFARVPDADVTWTRGAPATFKSSDIATRGFCAACGTPLTFKWRPEATSFTLASFDAPAMLVPVNRFGVEATLPWSVDLSAMPSEATPDMGPGFVNHQHPDHDT